MWRVVNGNVKNLGDIRFESSSQWHRSEQSHHKADGINGAERLRALAGGSLRALGSSGAQTMRPKCAAL